MYIFFAYTERTVVQKHLSPLKIIMEHLELWLPLPIAKGQTVAIEQKKHTTPKG